jgi:hypothetical protein
MTGTGWIGYGGPVVMPLTPAGPFVSGRGIHVRIAMDRADDREAHVMTIVNKQMLSIFVDRTSRQWIVLDPEGIFWVVPAHEEGWDQRQPFTPTDESDLEPVPAHYRYMLGLPH